MTRLNAGYGATASPYAFFYDIRIAKAITYTAQLVTIWISNYIKEKIGIETVYMDTDSVASNSVIYSSSFKALTIEDYWYKVGGEFFQRGPNNYVKILNKKSDNYYPDRVLSASSNGTLQYKNVNYIMKHYATKRMFSVTPELQIGDEFSEIIVTEDHSLIVFRNNEMIEITPKEALRTDKILFLTSIDKGYRNFFINDLGVKSMWVYDIEVEDNHNFFANNILVHNSCYLSVEKQVRRYCELKKLDYEALTYDQKKEILDIINTKINQCIEEGYKVLSDRLNVYQETFVMKREIYGNKGVWLGKKNYIIKMIDKEGASKKPEDPPYVRGYDIAKKSATIPFIINILSEYVELVFDGNIENLLKFEKDKFSEFKKMKPSQMFIPRSVSALNNYSSYSDKGIQAHLKGAIFYNSIVEDLGLQEQYPLVYNQGKVRFSYIKEPNVFQISAIAFSDESDGDKFFDLVSEKYNLQIDYDKMWETQFIKPARRLIHALKIDLDSGKRHNFLDLIK